MASLYIDACIPLRPLNINQVVMMNWIYIGGMMLIVFAVKCVKESVDVRAMSRMDSAERAEVLARRHFYDNHA